MIWAEIIWGHAEHVSSVLVIVIITLYGLIDPIGSEICLLNQYFFFILEFLECAPVDNKGKAIF